MNSDWNAFLRARNALVAEDRVTDFGNPEAEMQAAENSTIMADLSHLALLQVEGDDAVSFLQGQLTNDIRLLDGHHSQYAGYCTAKGRLLAIVLAFSCHGQIHLQLNGALAASVAKRLKMYVLRSRVVITDASNDIVRIGVAGPEAEAALKKVFGDAPAQPHDLLTREQTTLLRLPGITPRFQVFTPATEAPAVWDALQEICAPVGHGRWEWLEIHAGVPEITPATQEAFVPQMVNLDLLGGINFKKGCYTGQEIVARTHYLGKVKRRTQLAHIASAQAPSPGDAVYGLDSQEPVGMVVNAAAAPRGGYDLLVEVRLESAEAGGLRLSGPDGPMLTPGELPYAL